MQELLNQIDDSSWESYKRSLGKAMEAAADMGISRKMMTEGAAYLGSYLANSVHPDIPENNALKELWEVSNHSEHKAIASAMMKLAAKSAE